MHQRRIIGLRETVTAAAYRPLAVERGKSVVRGVKILGLESQNGRRYLREAVARALPKYEGILVNIDHPPDPLNARRFVDRFAQMRGVRMEPGGLHGDLCYNPKHEMAECFLWWAEHNPRAIGMSHNATGEGVEDMQGTFVVDEIVDVFSVDVVADPATSNGLFEAGRRAGRRPAGRSPWSEFLALLKRDD